MARLAAYSSASDMQMLTISANLGCDDEAHAQQHLLWRDVMRGAALTAKQAGSAHKRDSSLPHQHFFQLLADQYACTV